ncbi:MAG: hypothetical protein NC102_11580 [Clostridium sp.]|nr:hypothetical protein [Clostridium sp.]
MKSTFSLVISVVSLILSVALCVTVYPSPATLDFDYLGMIVGVISFLVAILLGWQIYNSLVIDSRLARLNRLYSDVSGKHQALEELSHQTAHLSKAYAKLTENIVFHALEIRKEEMNFHEVVNTYFRYLECLGLFLRASDKEAPALCMLNADRVLD